ncbi:MAG: LptF/LptG family permease [Bacteroidales bacterium]|nr:LptF/LptG family permease [Candidatus Colimorpha onthohippi]
MRFLRYKLIDRYILLKYLKTFLAAMALIIVIVITFDVSEKLDDFLGGHAPIKEVVFDYYLNFIPGFINLYSPLFIFISVIFFTSKMAGNTEIIAILGSGISYRRLLRPFLHGSIIVAILVFFIGNFIIPISNEKLMEFDKKYLTSRKDNYFSNIHFQPKVGVQVYAESFDVENQAVYRFRCDTYDDQRNLIKRVTADNATFDSVTNQWRCYGYFVRTIDGTKEQLERHMLQNADLGVNAQDFNQKALHIETMNTFELYRYIGREQLRGSSNVIPSQIEFYQRLFNPLAIIIMTIIGVAVSSRKSRGGIGMHLAIGITLAFAFIVFMKITTVFATNGNMPPALAILFPQINFGAAAIWLVRKAPK